MENLDILIIDDEPDFLEQARMFLENADENINVDTAISGEEGWEKLEQNSYEGIVSDYKMRKMDGLELLEKLRKEKNSDLPFILFTGKGREEVAMKALNLGADRYLQKRGDPKSQYGVLANAIKQEVSHWQAKEDLRSSEKKYRDLSEKSLVGIHVIQDDVLKYVNPEFCNIFGYDREELIGENYLKIVAPESEEHVREGIEKRQKEDADEERYTFRGITKDGEKIDVEVFSVPSSYQGRPAAQGTLVDITERKRAKERFSRFFKRIPLMTFILDENGTVEEVNETFCKKIGYNEKELIGKKLSDLPGILSEQDRNKTIDRFERIINGEKLDPIEVKYYTKDGNERYAEMNSIRFEEPDGSPGVVGFVRDITEQKKAEKDLLRSRKKYRTLFSKINCSAYFLNIRGEFEEVNQAFCELIGCDREKVSNKHFKDVEFLPPESIEKAEEKFKERLDGGKVEPYELEVRTSDGIRKKVEIHGKLLRENGEILGEVGLVREAELEER